MSFKRHKATLDHDLPTHPPSLPVMRSSALFDPEAQTRFEVHSKPSARSEDKGKGEGSQWMEISIHINPVAHEAVSSFLFDLGSSGLVLDKDSLRAYFPCRENWANIRAQAESFLFRLKEIFPEIHSPWLRFCKIEGRDWAQNWRRFFHTDRVTPNLLIVPAWEPAPSTDDHHVIRMDPGPAFGTGKHPTTRMCLAAMERIAPHKSWTMLDVGTGSGILAMYAAKLGAKRVVALDLDPDALRWAGRNIRLNDLESSIQLSSVPLSQQKGSFSMVVANLTLNGILPLSQHLYDHLRPRGWLILSGILEGQLIEIREAFTGKGLNGGEIEFMEEWACVVMRKSLASGGRL